MKALSFKAIFLIVISITFTVAIWSINTPYFFEDYISSNFYEKQKIYLDIGWKEVSDSSQAKYYREYRLDQDSNFIGKVQDFYISGQPQWEGHISSMKPFIREGTCIKWYQNGQVNSEINYNKNKKEGICKFYFDDGSIQPSQYYKDDTLLFSAYNLKSLIKSYDLHDLLESGTHVFEGNYYAEYNQDEKAISSYLSALQIVPNYTYAKEALAQLYFEVQMYNESIALWKEIQTSHPEGYRVLYYIADVYNEMGEQKIAKSYYDEVIRYRSRSVAFQNVAGDAYNEIGNIYLSNENYSGAIAQYSQAIETIPSESYYYSNRAWAYLLTENDSLRLLATDDILFSKQLNPKNPDAYKYSAIANTYINDLNGAWQDVLIAKELEPNDVEIENLYRQIYALRNPPSYASNSGYDSSDISVIDLLGAAIIAYEIYDISKDIRDGNYWEATKQIATDAAITWGIKKIFGE